MRTFFKLPRLIVHRNVTTPIYKLQFFIHFIFVQRFSHFLRETTKKKSLLIILITEFMQ